MQGRLEGTQESEKLKQVYIGKLDSCEGFVLFLRNLAGCLPESAIKAQDMSTRFFILGKQRLESELNIVKVLKQLRTLTLLEKPSREAKA